MDSAPDLFASLAYPNHPGARKASTSQAAAEFAAPRAPFLREKVLGLLVDAALTADECASKLGETVLSIRPRLSELRAKGLIFDTGRTRANSSGLQAKVWRGVRKDGAYG